MPHLGCFGSLPGFLSASEGVLKLLMRRLSVLEPPRGMQLSDCLLCGRSALLQCCVLFCCFVGYFNSLRTPTASRTDSATDNRSGMEKSGFYLSSHQMDQVKLLSSQAVLWKNPTKLAIHGRIGKGL